MVTFIIYTDYVSQLSYEANKREIEVLEEFNYCFGSFLKVRTEKPILKPFLEEYDFLIEEVKQIKKGP